jgi:hypothetical protein
MEHTVNANILVNIRPVDALAVTDDLKVLPLLGSGIREAP